MNKKNKFLFDLHDFEKEAEEAREKRLNKNPPAPTFSLEDMEEARKQAHEAGREAGLQQAKDSLEQKTELLIQSLSGQIALFTENETQRHNDFIKNAVNISFQAIEKTLPAILDAEKLTLIQKALDNFFTGTIPKGSLTLLVHPDMREAVEKHAENLHSDLQVKEDSQIAPTDIRLEWQDGAYEFMPARLMEQILHIIQEHAPEDIAPLDDTPKTAHTYESDPELKKDETDT
jgi:flagellar biosynthesis/type III secretory pathway protein FliH